MDSTDFLYNYIAKFSGPQNATQIAVYLAAVTMSYLQTEFSSSRAGYSFSMMKPNEQWWLGFQLNRLLLNVWGDFCPHRSIDTVLMVLLLLPVSRKAYLIWPILEIKARCWSISKISWVRSLVVVASPCQWPINSGEGVELQAVRTVCIERKISGKVFKFLSRDQTTSVGKYGAL